MLYEKLWFFYFKCGRISHGKAKSDDDLSSPTNEEIGHEAMALDGQPQDMHTMSYDEVEQNTGKPN